MDDGMRREVLSVRRYKAGFEAKTLHDCKRMAIAYAACVS